MYLKNNITNIIGVETELCMCSGEAVDRSVETIVNNTCKCSGKAVDRSVETIVTIECVLRGSGKELDRSVIGGMRTVSSKDD